MRGAGRERWYARLYPRLPWAARWAVVLAGGAAAFAVYRASGSELLQLLVVYLFVWAVPQLLVRVAGVPMRAGAVQPRDRQAPARVTVPSVAFFLGWFALVFVVLDDRGLGAWFVFWVVFMPWLEVQTALTRRDLRSGDGGARWPPVRPVRDGLVTGVLLGAFVAGVIVLTAGSVGEAVGNGLLIGVVGGIAYGTAENVRLADHAAEGRPDR